MQKIDPNPGPGQDSYEIFYGSGGHSGPYISMQAVIKRVDQIWKAKTESHVHVHLRHRDGLGGYLYLVSYRLKYNGEKIWPKPLAEWYISRDKVWNQRKNRKDVLNEIKVEAGIGG